MSDINELHNEGEILPARAHTEILAEQFLAGSYQSHSADHETTSSTSFRPMRTTLNDTYTDQVKQHKQKTATKSQRIQNCSPKYPRTIHSWTKTANN